MDILVIGNHGGIAKNARGTSYLIDGSLLIDAGSCASGLGIEAQNRIDNILISHSHLDHVCDLAFIVDNCFETRKKPFEVYTSRIAKDNIKTHIFNNAIWPDFTRLPSADNPVIRFHLLPKGKFPIGEHSITATAVNHPAGGHGFIVEHRGSAVLFTLDTGPTKDIWEAGRRTANLKAIFTEVSFPNRLGQLAHRSGHHTPESLARELAKMPEGVPVMLGHLKPLYEEEIKTEIAGLKNGRLHFIGNPEKPYRF